MIDLFALDGLSESFSVYTLVVGEGKRLIRNVCYLTCKRDVDALDGVEESLRAISCVHVLYVRMRYRLHVAA